MSIIFYFYLPDHWSNEYTVSHYEKYSFSSGNFSSTRKYSPLDQLMILMKPNDAEQIHDECWPNDEDQG